jgi:flagellar hook-associated protein 3 FlgL
MRVTQSMPQTELLSNLNNLMTSILTSQQQLASGTSIQEPSDNPAGTAQYLAITAAQAWNTQWTQNAQAASSYMGAASQALTQLDQILQSASSIAVSANSGTLTPSDLQAQAGQVGQLVQEAQALANTQYAGQYVFGGTSGQAPWNSATSQWNLTASPGSVSYEVGSGVDIPVSVDGFALFQGPLNASGRGILSPNAAASASQGVLEQLQNDLATGTTAGLSTDIQNLQDAIAHVTTIQSDLGARMQRVQTVTSALGQIGVQLTTQAAQVDSTNMPKIVAQLTNQEAVYQAALDIGAKMLMPTLASLIG